MKMKNYNINGKVVEITLDSGKVVKCMTEWVDKTSKELDLSIHDTIQMWLEDNDYLVNEEQDKLDKEAKGKVKITAKADKPKVKTQKERVQKENPTKEKIIKNIAETLENIGVSNLIIENKAKLITFSLNNEDFKVDLVQKRRPKA